MKKFHVYGMGNALVDLEYAVTDQILHQLKVDKALMTLIDEDRQHELVEALKHEPHIKAAGGSGANAVMTSAVLGSECFYSCIVANDSNGDFFLADFAKNGVRNNLENSSRPDGITGTCIAMLTPDTERSMNTHLGITATFSKAQLDEQALKGSEYLYIEGYLVAADDAREAAIYARQVAQQNGVKVALTLSDPNMITYFRQGLADIIGTQIDLLFCNKQEALMFCATTDLLDAAEELKSYAKQFVITLGAEGSLVFNGKEMVEVPSFPVTTIDTLGAGDTFAGTFLHSLIETNDYHQAAVNANFAASRVVSQSGPRLTDKHIEEIREHLGYTETA